MQSLETAPLTAEHREDCAILLAQRYERQRAAEPLLPEIEDFEAHVAGDDDLMHGGHADEIGAEGAEGADFRRGFVAGAEDGEIDAVRQGDVLLCCFSVR